MDLRALVVCPDQDAAGLLTKILAELGVASEHTPSISSGQQLLNKHRFDAVVFDYRSDRGSEEFLAQMRQSAKNRSSLLIAIVDEDFNARPVFGLGANFVLYRPLSSERTRISLRAARGLMKRERRRAPRARVHAKANVAYPGGPETKATLADLSDGGTLIETANRLPSAGKVYFEFALPGQAQIVRLSGEVAWQDASGRTGIRFVDVPQSSRRLMQSWLQQKNMRPANEVAPQAEASKISGSPEFATGSDFRPQPKSECSEAKDSGLISRGSNRRGELRFACKLGAEVYRLGSTVPNRCTLSDISEGGCYVEMPSPLGGQSGVEIVVRTHDIKLKIRGQVLATHPGFGMGVRFMFRDSVEKEEVLRLLAVLASGPVLEQPKR